MRGLLCCALLAATLLGGRVAFADDATIHQSIALAISRAKSIPGLAESEIKVNVDQGHVQVVGRCGNNAVKRHILNLVRFTPGVVVVDDQIQIRQPEKNGTIKAPTAPRTTIDLPPPSGEMSTQLSALNRSNSASFPQRPIRFPSYQERQIAAQRKATPTSPTKVASTQSATPAPVADPPQIRTLPWAPVESVPAKRPAVAIDHQVKPASIDRREFTGAERFPLPEPASTPRAQQPTPSGNSPTLVVPPETTNEIPAELLMASLADSASISQQQATAPQMNATPDADDRSVSSRVVWVIVSLAAGMFLFVKFFRRAD